MKVLMFGWEFPPHISGGLGTACYGLVKGMIYHGIDVTFVTPRLFGDEDKNGFRLLSASDVDITVSEDEYENFWKKLSLVGVDSYLIPYLSPIEFTKHTEKIIHERKKSKEKVFNTRFQFSGEYKGDLFEEVSRYALVGAQIALNGDHDIIHAHDWMTYPAGMAAKEVTGKPLVVHVHATEYDRSGEHVNQRIWEIERNGMLAADMVVAVSNRTRAVVIERYGIDPEKVFTVHNALITSPEGPKPKRYLKDKIITFLGRVTFQKGPEYFVEAARLVLKTKKNVRFVMAGSGDMLQRMIELVAQYRIGDHFHFTGFLQGPEVREMFERSDVYVMPSVSEPFGISPLEAMQSRVPVIISRQSGVAEILHHAIKIDFWDIDAMADAIHALITYDGISRMFRRMSRREVENLKWDNVAFKVIDLYKRLI